MRSLTLYVFIFSIVFANSSCKRAVSEEELIKYIANPDNGLTVKKETKNIQYEIAYRPLSMILKQEFGERLNVSDSIVLEKQRQYAQFNYFILTLSAGDQDVLYGGSGNFNNFSENIQKLSFNLAEYIHIKTADGDTIYLADYNMPNFYGMARSTQILLAFIKPEKETKELEIIIEELGFGTGKQKFIFRKEDLESIPDLVKNS